MEIPDYVKNRYWGDFLPDGVTLDLDIPDISLIDVFKYQMDKPGWSDHVKLDFFGKEYTNRELDVLTRRFAAALKDLGVKKGEVVALWLPNCPQFSIVYFAAVLLGATMTTMILRKWLKMEVL